MSALPLLRLVDQGRVSLDDPVVAHWPEYGRAGKSETTVDDVLSHRAGLPGVVGAATGSIFDWSAFVAEIEAASPVEAPGQGGCYHTFTYGHLVGELFRRVDGRDPAVAVAQDIAGPFGLDLAFGLDADGIRRCAEMVASDVALFKRDKYLLDGGHDILNQHEA